MLEESVKTWLLGKIAFYLKIYMKVCDLITTPLRNFPQRNFRTAIKRILCELRPKHLEATIFSRRIK